MYDILLLDPVCSFSIAPLVAAGIISAGAGLLGKLFNNSDQKHAAQNQIGLMNHQYNLQQMLMQSQNAYNVQQWQRENAYNSPLAQRRRLDAAGLNGGLLMSQGNSLGTGGSITPSSGGSISAPHADANDKMLGMQQFLSEMGMNAAQIELMHSEANKNNAEANEIAPNAEANRNFLKSSANLNDEQAKVCAENVNLIREQIRNTRVTADWLEKSFDLRLRDLSSQIGLRDANAKFFDAQTAAALYNLENIAPLEKSRLEKYIKEQMPAEIAEIKARTKCSQAQAAAAWANAFYTQSLKVGQDIQNSYNGFILGDPRYREAIISGAVSNTNKLTEEANFWDARGYNELQGYPYIFSVPFSFSASGGATVFGTGGNGSVSLSGSMPLNPVQFGPVYPYRY